MAGTTNYTYDGNGNVLTNSNTVNTGQNKTYTYNVLNLPQTVTISGGTVTYTYDAAGNKLRKQSSTLGNTEYITGIQYGATITGLPDFIQTEEGRAVPNGTTAYKYYYYLGDNLGNTRITFDSSTGTATTLQKDDYLPFGMEINRSITSPKNEYLYNKKELQEELGQYDYGARFYDPVIARWLVSDPLAEKSRKWSSYNYVMSSPIRMIDPDGMFTIEGADKNVNGGQATYEKNKDGTVTWTNATEDTKRVGNAMLKTDIGTKKLNDMISSDISISISINKTDLKLSERYSPILGQVEATSFISVNGKFKIATEKLTIFEKGIAAMEGDEVSLLFPPGSKTFLTKEDLKKFAIRPKNYSREEHIGSVGTHEATHGTEPGSSPMVSDEISRETTPYENGAEYYKEIDKQKPKQ